MQFSTIRKSPRPEQPRPNLEDYDEAYASFRWSDARAELDGLPDGGGLNMAYEAVDRHARGGARDRTALRWLGKRGERVEWSYGELGRESSRFANALAALGVSAGDRVFVLAPRIPELYAAVLGGLKHRVVVSPLFPAFGPEPLAQRLGLGEARVLVTTDRLYRRKVEAIRGDIQSLEHVILIAEESRPSGAAPPSGAGPHRGETRVAGTLDWTREVMTQPSDYAIGPTDPDTPALLHFTSGTTGAPKGAVHVHEAVVAHHVTGKLALDMHPGDLYWCTADPGWVTGTSYGILAPFTNAVTMVVDEAELDVRRWYDILERERVEIWYTAPTAIRMLMRAGAEPARGRDFSRLRFMASVGEPLNPEAVVWGEQIFGKPFHDNWWQTETGGIMIANFASMDVRPGSMGRPLPGVTATLVRKTEDGHLEEITEPDVEGEIALRPDWPSRFRAYFRNEARYEACFVDGWYLSGDLARRDADGYFWFVGRSDDVIKTAGHLIGPFEVESVLMEHPAVVEAGVIGKPDEVAGTILKAFCALRPGHTPSSELARDVIGFARKRLGSVAAPREIAFVEGLPKTRSGKIMRRLLKARELGLPEGDLSMLEGSEA